jgi:hypothetical protein
MALSQKSKTEQCSVYKIAAPEGAAIMNGIT